MNRAATVGRSSFETKFSKMGGWFMVVKNWLVLHDGSQVADICNRNNKC